MAVDVALHWFSSGPEESKTGDWAAAKSWWSLAGQFIHSWLYFQAARFAKTTVYKIHCLL